MTPVPPLAFSSNADDRPPLASSPNRVPGFPDLQEPAQAAHPASPASPRGPDAPDAPSTNNQVPILDEVRTHLQTYVSAPDDDLDLLTLWAAHTHLVEETYTTPRLLLDSPLPGSGKTTVLEHLERLCVNPLSMASVSPALIARLIDDAGITTMLIDEADRTLRPDKPGSQDVTAILNSGYKRGATRPVLVPVRGEGWETRKMPTFSPVAMAGNAPALAEDTMTRTVRVLLLPDANGTIQESDWELLDEPARAIGARLAEWADTVRATVRVDRGSLPAGVQGRRAECWRPLKRVAQAAGGRWPSVVDDLAIKDLEDIALDRDEGFARAVPHVLLLQDIAATWPIDRSGEPHLFAPTALLLDGLVKHHPQRWGRQSSRGTALSPQGLGRMLTRSFRIRSTRPTGRGQRGYSLESFRRPWESMQVVTPGAAATVGTER